jgi:hypothetical protein
VGWDVHGLGWGIGAAVVALAGGGSVLALFRRPDAAITPNPAAIAAEARAAEALPHEAGLSLMAP